jgi:hypothetical protein
MCSYKIAKSNCLTANLEPLHLITDTYGHVHQNLFCNGKYYCYKDT